MPDLNFVNVQKSIHIFAKAHTEIQGVLIITPRLNMPGGVSNYYRVLKPYLENGNEFFEIGAKENENSPLQSLMRILFDYFRFLKKMISCRHRLVHINVSLGIKAITRDGVLLLVAKLFKKPVLIFFHGWDINLEQAIEKRYQKVFSLVFNKADGIIVLANEFSMKLKSWKILCPIFLETTVVKDDIFSEPIEKQQPPANHPITILFLTRIEKTKGIYETIDAFMLLQQKCFNTRLLIVGDGSELAPAQKYADEKKPAKIIFYGYLTGKEKGNTFLESDIYFFPTNYGEGMPTTVLEAMAHGLPVVTRPVGGLKDFFENDNMGYITNSNDPHVLAGLIEKLIVDDGLRKRMGAYNRAYSKKHFSASEVSRRLHHIYQQITL